jgi:hypothetical protein
MPRCLVKYGIRPHGMVICSAQEQLYVTCMTLEDLLQKKKIFYPRGPTRILIERHRITKTFFLPQKSFFALSLGPNCIMQEVFFCVYWNSDRRSHVATAYPILKMLPCLQHYRLLHAEEGCLWGQVRSAVCEWAEQCCKSLTPVWNRSL